MAITQSLQNQLAAFGESWASDHADAMECWEIEGWLRIGLSLFDLIRAVDEHWSDAVRAGSAEVTGLSANEIGELYSRWLAPCELALARVKELERKGFTVKDADRFRRACRRTRLVLAADPAALLAADRELDVGKGYSLQEVRDDLHRRHLKPGA
jgi:hypothetical protein